MRTLILVALSGLLFLLAAKTHGRQLRLERELRGYTTVVFGGTNPPFVESLWRAERVRFALAAPLCVALLLAALYAGGLLRGAGTAALGVVLWAPSLALLGLAGLSLGRLVATLVAAHDGRGAGLLVGAARRSFEQAAALGSLGWWGLSLAILTVTFTVALAGRVNT